MSLKLQPKPREDISLLSSTLNLLYIQTVADLERGWIVTSEETKQQLALMQARGSKRQYMEVIMIMTHNNNN